jgi:hypothetical protein
VLKREIRLHERGHYAQSEFGLAQLCEHRRSLARAQPVLEAAMAIPARRTALAAMHAADFAATNRRLPTRPVVVLATRLASCRQPEIAPVAIAQQTGHGVIAGFNYPPPPPRRRAGLSDRADGAR